VNSASPSPQGRPPEGAPTPVDLAELPPLPSQPFVSVIMPVRDMAAHIEASVGALLAQDYPADRYEVLVADGDSEDDTVQRVEALAAGAGPAVRVLRNEGRTRPAALNVGLRVAAGDLVIPVDGHCIVAGDFLRRAVEVSAETGAACVGGPIHTVGIDETARAIAAAQSSTFGVGGVAFRTTRRAGPVDTLAYGAYRREVFDAVGIFDEELVRNQDDEFNLRVTLAGGTIWMDPTISSTYHARSSFSALWRQYRLYGTYKVRVMQKHRMVPSARHLVPAAFVSGVAAATLLTVATGRLRWLAAVVGPYLAANVIASRTVARRDGVPTAAVASATTVMHMAYGVGTFAGVFRFRRRFGDRAVPSSASRAAAARRPGPGGGQGSQ
jgi:succinoglycan biosynthesis protein ExoA